MVTAAHAQRRMVNAAKSNDNKVNKRGLTEDPAVARRKDKLPLGPVMIGFFLFVVIGSSVLQIINQAGKGSVE